MWTWMQRASSPQTAYVWALKLQPVALCLCAFLFVAGVVDSLLLAPADYQQGDVYRVMYLHVPMAIGSLCMYVSMAIAAFVYLVWKLKVADIMVACAARLGCLYTFLTLLTGAIWGKPTWGTFWIWDARLTSELILLFIYFGVMFIRTALPDRTQAAKAASIVTLIGFVNIPVVHYSVYWWNTLHQGSSLFLFKQSTIAPSMLHPLLLMIGAFIGYSVWIMCVQVRAELLEREAKTQWVARLKGDGCGVS